MIRVYDPSLYFIFCVVSNKCFWQLCLNSSQVFLYCALLDVRRNVVSSSYWCGVHWWSSLTPVDLFFFFPSSLSPPLKITVCFFWGLTFQLDPLFFWFLSFDFSSFIEVLFVFNFIIQSQFTKYYILQCGPHSLDF